MLGTLVFAWAYPGQGGASDFALKYLLVFVIDLPMLLAGLLGLALLHRVLPPRPRPLLGFLFGLGVPLAALGGSLWLGNTAHSRALLMTGLPLLAAMTLPGLMFARGRLPRLPALAVGLLGLLAAGLLITGLGRREVPGIAEDLGARAALPAATVAADEVAGMPDLLLISIDTLRADTVLDPEVPTPTLDRLRERSRWAPYGLAPAPSTLPSHITMMVGESPLRHGAYTNLGRLTPGPDTLAQTLQQAGYRTAGVAANGLLRKSNGFARGFEQLINVAHATGDASGLKKLTLSTRRTGWSSTFLSDRLAVALGTWVVDRRWVLQDEWKQMSASAFAPKVEAVADAHLGQLLAEERPYFYFLHFMAPHAPYEALPPWRGALSAELPVPAALEGVNLGSNDVTYIVGSAVEEGHPEAGIGLELLEARYGEELMMVDDALGRILGRIEAGGRPTWIVFTSDHGEHFGEHTKMRHGNTLFAPALRVPFMIAGPGLEPGMLPVVPRLADIPLTMLRAAGFPLTSYGEGRDLLGSPGVDPFHSVHEDKIAVHANGHKLVLSWDSNLGPESPLEPMHLFPIRGGAAGLLEAEDLLGDPATEAVLAQLLAMAEAARDASIPTVRREFTQQDLADLAALGYVFDEDGHAVED